MGRSRRRHRPACADRRLRRRHRARGDEVRRLGARRPPHHRPRRLRERLGAPPRSPSRTRSARSSGACGSTRRASSSTARSGRRWATSTRAASTSGSSARCAPRSTTPVTRPVRIVASGGFSVEKIEEFERRGVPVDAYGVGSSLIRGENDFTADIVVADGSRARRSVAAFARTRGSSVSSSPSSGMSTQRRLR